ncbi:MAG: hypothetical protein JJT76_12995 [Clostridiaceae bacterium]|nr:hypothetical protein [Clostridiaceae bacterium]
MLFNNEFIHPACEARAIQLTRNKAILQNYEDEKVRKLAFDLEAHKEYVKTIERDLVVCKKEAERLGKLLMRRLKDGRDLDERRSSCTEEEIRRQIEDSD